MVKEKEGRPRTPNMYYRHWLCCGRTVMSAVTECQTLYRTATYACTIITYTDRTMHYAMPTRSTLSQLNSEEGHAIARRTAETTRPSPARLDALWAKTSNDTVPINLSMTIHSCLTAGETRRERNRA